MTERLPTVCHGDCLLVMPALTPDSIDAIVTDPPYGLKFMGKGWDRGVPGVPFWLAALRVTKPGAYLLAFGGTRTYHRLTVAIEDAGWEIRDCLSWLYGSGFPKSHNGAWGGTALKPAWEPIIMARKPMVATVAKNVAQHGTGGLNIEGCRIEATERPHRVAEDHGVARSAYEGGAASQGGSRAAGTTSQGRWPANVVLDEDAARVLDEQTGTLKSGDKLLHHVRTTTKTRVAYGEREALPEHYPGDSGGASRFFYTAKASRAERNAGLDGMPEVAHQRYGEQGQGPTPQQTPRHVQRAANHHPTVKPLDLMQWLCRLVTPKGGLILDPFCGSGTTGRAAVAEGFRFIGIEKEAEYVEIARARIAEYAPLFSDGAA